ncbi:MAG TPA: glycosyltransferase family 1 protein, partial [Acidobacteriota bacterium]|nr:glycosyltransferase family 1 protein [Acidobacteriota bacterium]
LQVYFKQEIPADFSRIKAEPVLLRSEAHNLKWQQWTLCRELQKRKTDLFFSPAAGCPWYFKGIQVLTVPDFSFFLYPHWFTTKERLSRQLNLAFSLRQADRIYVISPFVREELIAHFSISPQRVTLTPIGVMTKNPDPKLRAVLRARHAFTGAKIVLYVGSIFNRRHLPVLLESLKRLSSEALLVVIGENRTHPRQDLAALAEELSIAQRVRLMEYVSQDLLEEYYRMADLFVYLSDYEGFGIPPLEAMSYGIPVILSEKPAMDAIFKGAAYFVKNNEPGEVSRAMQDCLEDGAQRERMIAAGKELSLRYSWDETARVISEDWERLLAARN